MLPAIEGHSPRSFSVSDLHIANNTSTHSLPSSPQILSVGQSTGSTVYGSIGRQPFKQTGATVMGLKGRKEIEQARNKKEIEKQNELAKTRVQPQYQLART